MSQICAIVKAAQPRAAYIRNSGGSQGIALHPKMKGRCAMQAYNPYLPSWEYTPDGEPHVFGNRVYVYGSHDQFRGPVYCLND